MLTVLRVKNFILMEELELALEPGLNVLTGETGAGKSIVVGALNLVLGGRASADHVRPGGDEAEVEALFDVSAYDLSRAPALAQLREAGVLTDGEIAIRRVVSTSGRSRAYLNGKLSTAGELAALASELADVASQHESVALTDPATHLQHLDRFADLDERRNDLASAVSQLEAMLVRIRELRKLDKTRAEREAFLRFQLQGIGDVSPRAGETDELANERKRLRHMGRLVELVQRAASRLEAEDGLCDQLARVAGDLRAAAELDSTIEPLARVVDGAWAELGEVASTCARYAGDADRDPNRLAEIEERLYRIEGLLRQHGPTIGDVLASQTRLESELESLTSAESRLADEESAMAARLPEVARDARALSEKRKAAADRLGAAISTELGALGMGGARVLVEVERLSGQRSDDALVVDGNKLGRDGIDRVEFLISPNKGIDPKPLRKIASGGELSRALLALKRVLAESGPAGLYVFDEVDTGVGGAVAERIGAAIADVARHHQVLCITHLAPIAAFARAHFVVRKSADGAVTTSSVERVKNERRVHEVARMLSGAKVTTAALATAEELLADAARQVKRLGSAERPAPAAKKPSRPQSTRRAP